MNYFSNFSSDGISDIGRMRRFSESALVLFRRYRWLALFVLLPTLLAIAYYGLVAADQYESQSSFVIRAPGQQNSQLSTLANLIQTTGLPASQDETNEVLGYIRSRGALTDLTQVVDAHAIYTSPVADRLARYPFPGKPDRFDNFYKYYRDMVSAEQEHETGLVTLRVKAFTPKDSYVVNRALLDLSERLVNRLNDKAQQQAIQEAQKRVDEAADRLRQVRVQLSLYRNSQDLIDPERQAGAILDVISKLTIEKASLQSQLDVMQRMTPNHPGILSLRSRLAAINAIIGRQTDLVVGNGSAIASKLGQYEALIVEQQFATQLLTAASATMEQARADAAKQHFYLQRISESNLPDVADYPKRLKKILTIFGTALCLYFIVWMIVVGILEHSPDD